jgi:D-mannonate dehydratase
MFAPGATKIDEDDPSNTKIATMVNARASDDQFLFLQQIGVRWVHVQFPLDTNFELIESTQKRLARYNIQIHCGIVDHYRSLNIQLGRPGKDEDIEKFQTFIRDLGRLGIYSTKIDFHPGNTYTTRQIKSPRGYLVREYNVEDFRKSVEKQMFDRVYTATISGPTIPTSSRPFCRLPRRPMYAWRCTPTTLRPRHRA